MISPAVFQSRGFAVSLAFVSTLLVAGGLTYGYFFAPHVRVGSRQPIPFSHRLHVSVKQIDCRFCHSGAGHSPNAGIPSATKCLYCHKYIIPNHPYIRQVRATAESGDAIRWRKITWLPDHAYFSHQRHIRKDIECGTCHEAREPLDRLNRKGVDCRCCHGPIETMDRLYEANRFRMGFCRDCHLQGEASLDCWTCHL